MLNDRIKSANYRLAEYIHADDPFIWAVACWEIPGWTMRLLNWYWSVSPEAIIQT